MDELLNSFIDQSRMKLPGTIRGREELMFMATCRWCREDVNPAFYVAGFQIHDLPPEELSFIQTLIDSFGFQDS